MIGARIRQARLLAGMSQQDVADALRRADISVQKANVSGFERGKTVPDTSLLMALSRFFDVPLFWLLHEPRLEMKWLGYRKRTALPAKTREAIESYARDVAELHLELRRLLSLEKEVSFPEGINVTSLDDAEKAAGALRSEWELGDKPVSSLTQAAESNGVIIIEWDRPTERFDGLSGWCEDNIPIIVTKANVDPDRKRFNLAHELGHLVMNTPEDMPEDNVEKLAHRFAGALLVPPEAARRELGEQRNSISFAELGTLKRRYGLSMQGWMYRARDLGIVSPRLAHIFWLEVSRRKWRKNEPYPVSCDEEPTRLDEMILQASENELVSDERVLQALPHYEFPVPVIETDEFPTTTEFLGMSEEEQEYWMQRSYELAEDLDIEEFEAFGEEEF
ncbi:MAG: XRE family transcriptional regulator [Anaerolineaceae bacterium]|nr:XRE family transcriptional regulator [Anaerolineaceae bacterium]